MNQEEKSLTVEREWHKFPCSRCKHRWPNEQNPNEEIGSGCDRPECEFRPDSYPCFEEKELPE